ncbi:MAG: ribosomal L7Ae/L30e/S12e/Gadd45 family protein [Nitrososphaerales archaeon]|nr:ribosomal L7Ae/L30e/S12e/Gadd45 family protein [Nitrososphaerales archaeon]
MEPAQLSKLLKEAMKGGKYTIGAKESLASMKGAKAVICTKSMPAGVGAKLREEAKKHEVPVIDVSFTSAELAKLIGRPYKVSALALMSLGEANLKQLLR